MALPFVHLHNHSDYSLLDGACRIAKLVDKAKSFGMPAVGLTDHGNLFGAYSFYKECKRSGVNPIIGCELYLAQVKDRRDRTSKKARNYFHQIVFAQDRQGYGNLTRLVSSGFLEGFYYKPRVDKEILAQYSQGLIATSSCLQGEVNQLLLSDQVDQAEQTIGDYHDIFGRGNFYLELQDQGLPEEKKIIPAIIRLAQRMQIPLIATNDCHYLEPGDGFYHDVLLCVQTGAKLADEKRFRFPNHEFYFKSPEEMEKTFGQWPSALTNTVEIANRCNVNLDRSQYYLPKFDIPERYRSLEEYFRELTMERFGRRLAVIEANIPEDQRADRQEQYRNRLEYELKVICDMGYAGYFLVVWDLIQYAHDHKIPVGPGRGSAAGSLVAYSLGITDIDPLQYDLLFERFLNPERVSMPDIDIDFCMNGRGRLLEYVTNKYGRENVAQIITFGTMKAKAAIQDAGRVMGAPFNEVNEISKLVPTLGTQKLGELMQEDKNLQDKYRDNQTNKKILDTAMWLEGTVRHASTHAAGVVIAPDELVKFVPLYRGKNGEICTQMSMTEVEEIGLLKMDLLGLRTLTLIDHAVKMIAGDTGKVIDWNSIPLDDPETYALFCQGDTEGVFQFESEGMRSLLIRFRPDCIEHLIALNALYRPGPLGAKMDQQFIDRKDGKEKAVYPIAALEPILKETYGIIVYQEQVMQIAVDLADYTLGDADLLRRAMGKKKIAEMEKHRQIFVDRAEANGIDKKKAAEVYELMAEFAKYGFNKSHSAAYAYIAFQTAYLKRHFGPYFSAALLSSEIHNADRLTKYISLSKQNGISVLPPDINSSEALFSVKDGQVLFGLSGIRQVGDKVVQGIIEERQKRGPFQSFANYLERCRSRRLNKRVIENLISAGAFDRFSLPRKACMDSYEKILKWQDLKDQQKNAPQLALFAESSVAEDEEFRFELCDEWDILQKLKREKQSLGVYLTGHPLQGLESVIERKGAWRIDQCDSVSDGTEVVVAGMISQIKERKSKRMGEWYAEFCLEDTQGMLPAVLWPSAFELAKPFLQEDEPVLAEATVRKDDFGEGSGRTKLAVNRIGLLLGNGSRTPKILKITLSSDTFTTSLLERLREILKEYDSPDTGCRVMLLYRQPNRFEVLLKTPYRLPPTGQARQLLEELIGGDAIG